MLEDQGHVAQILEATTIVLTQFTTGYDERFVARNTFSATIVVAYCQALSTASCNGLHIGLIIVIAAL